MALTAAPRDLNKLNAFVRVAERRSFTKAAADLRTTPSVVSKHMKELENSLGFSLFNRSTHGIMLTDAGEGLFHNCLQMLASLDDFVVEARNLQKGPYGTLRVLTDSDYARHVLTPLISTFIRRCPELRIHLFVASHDSHLGEEGFDVIIRDRKPAGPGLIDADLGEIRHVVCASPKYFKQYGRPKKPQELSDHSCIVNLAATPKGWPFQDGTRRIHVEIKGALSSNSSDVQIGMALQAHGIIRVPRYAAKALLANGSLDAILDRAALSPERMRAYYSKAMHMPAKTTEFVNFLRSAMARR